jgi:hypothetical protein
VVLGVGGVFTPAAYMLLLLYLGCRRFTIVEAGFRFLIQKKYDEYRYRHLN